MNIYKSIIIIFILSISYSQDHFNELNKYLNEVDLSNTNRVLEFQMRLLQKTGDSENYDYTNKIYKTLYDEDLRKLMGNAVDALVPKWWWFEPDKEDTLDVINELEEYHKDYPNDFYLNIMSI